MNTATAKSTPMRATTVDLFLRLQDNMDNTSRDILFRCSGDIPAMTLCHVTGIAGRLFRLAVYSWSARRHTKRPWNTRAKPKVEATSSNSRGHTGDVNTSETRAVRQSHRQKGRSRLKRLVAHQNIQLIMFGTRLVLSIKFVSTIKSLTRR
jgi:hypothetical protein